MFGPLGIGQPVHDPSAFIALRISDMSHRTIRIPCCYDSVGAVRPSRKYIASRPSQAMKLPAAV